MKIKIADRKQKWKTKLLYNEKKIIYDSDEILNTAFTLNCRIHERTISLRFLGIILRVLSLIPKGRGYSFLLGFPPFSFTVYTELEFLKSLCMGARNRGGIGLSYRPARLHMLAGFIPWYRFLGSINF
jgi:hypothetical protein